MKPEIAAIVVTNHERAIGNNGQLLWHLPVDLRRFKVLTLGHPVLMGRKTFESLGRPLPKRTNIVITRDPEFRADGIYLAHSLKEAVEQAKNIEQEAIFIIGGGQIYREAMPLTTKLYLTLVEEAVEGVDTFFPDYSDFKKVVAETSGEDAGIKYHFLELER